jgi:hypothetical protein
VAIAATIGGKASTDRMIVTQEPILRVEARRRARRLVSENHGGE